MITQMPLTEQQREEREERFRYTDLEHPLMHVLFHMQLPLARERDLQS